MNEHEEVISTPEGTGDPQMRVSQAAIRYVATRRAAREFKDSTGRGVRSALLVFAREIGDPEIGRVRPRHIERWLETRKIETRSLRTQYSAVRTFLRWCVERKLLKSDPTVGIRGPRQPRSVPRSEPPAVIHQLLEACPDERARVIVLLMAQEGLRCVEVHRLELGDIDRLDWTARIHGKGDHERYLPLSAQTRDAISDYLGEYPTNGGPLVRSYIHPRKPLSANTIGDIVGKAFRAAGLKQRRFDGRSAHALRHSALQHILDSGATLEQVREIAGHSALSTTGIYLKRHHAVGELRDAMGGREY